MDEPELIKMIYKKHSLEGKNTKEIAEELNITEYKVKKILKRTNQFLTKYDKIEVRKYILDSIDEIKEEFEKIREELWDIIKKSKTEDKGDFKRLTALRDLKNLMELALKRLGELKTGLTTIQADTINVDKLNMVAAQIRERIWEQNKAVEEEGTIILKKPKPEVLDDYHKWKRKKRVSP
jgi:hypothetical protein